MRWDGKLHRPAKFGEGMQPGTVEWVQQQRQNRAEREIVRQIVREREEQREQPSVLVRAVRRIFGKPLP